MTGPAPADGLMLAMDTATRACLVALGRPDPVAVSRRDVPHRHGAYLLEQVEEALERAGATLDDLTALVVGTGPGSFTGLRVGLATAKTLAYALGLPLVALRTSDALRRAALLVAGASRDVAIVMPAGAHDHYLVREGEDPILVAPGSLEEALGDAPVLAVDMAPGPLGVEAARLAEAALAGLPAALLSLAADRLVAGQLDDPVAVVPAYVALPRGVRWGAEELAWSPDLR